MASSVYKKNLISSIYKKLNDNSKARCKTRFPDGKTDYLICQHRSMADNARTLIARLRGEIGGCDDMENPDKCRESINKLLIYLNGKLEDHEKSINQINSLKG